MAVESVASVETLEVNRHSGALQGTLDEKMRAFAQYAANLAILNINGWDNVQKAMAACLLADGDDQHPATFMLNNYCMQMPGGKILVDPKWQHVISVLQSRVPNFSFKVIEETDEVATVEMSNGRDTHRVSYSMKDAIRQGMAGPGGRNTDTYRKNSREMLLAKAIKRCGPRVGAAALANMPMGDDLDLSEPTTPLQPERLIERAVESVVGNGAPLAGVDASVKTKGRPEATEDPIKVLSATMPKLYGKQSVPVSLKNATVLYNAMMKEETGVDPKRAPFRSVREIGPIDAEKLTAYIHVLLERKKAKSSGPDDGETGASEGTGEPIVAGQERGGESAAPPPDEDVPPPAEVEMEPEPDDLTPGPLDEVGEFMSVVARARKALGSPKRNFVQEITDADGVTRSWYTDQTTFLKIGHAASILLVKNGEVIIEPEKLARLRVVLSDAVDAAERGGR